jgi:hypothetical protein
MYLKISTQMKLMALEFKGLYVHLDPFIDTRKIIIIIII